MNRFLTTLLFISFLCTCVSAQVGFNTTLRDQIDYSPPGMTQTANDLNDVWGYVAPDGTEYALVGLRNRISIVSLADPDNIVEVASVAGATSIWRDIKTYGDHAYVVADQGADGILSIDLSNLPASVSSVNYNTANTSGADLTRAHNIYIDEPNGLAYIAGANVNSGGMVIYDVATTPGVPAFVAFAPAVYAHDVYVQDDVMYASEINGGELTLYDVSNPQNITEIGATNTPFNFTHNAWADASGNYVFTTDERANAPVAAYDISDLNDIMLIDEFRPARSLGSGMIPHNVHVQDDYLVISSYTDGIEVVDASIPDNLVEVAYFDHWTGSDGGFNGSWGAYPFLPSGLILSTDISNGLFVIEADYQRAARLRGVVTDADNGSNLNGVNITIASAQNVAAGSDALGRYKTGIGSTGTFTVTYSLAGYNSESFELSFAPGTELIQDVQLTRKVQVAVTGNVTSTEDGGTVAGAEVRMTGEDGTTEDVSDGAGLVDFGLLFTGQYETFAGAWGFRDVGQSVSVTGNEALSFQLEPGYHDGFAVDQGWTVSGDATTGAWERGVPVGTSFGGVPANPGVDAEGDVGNLAYVTGNGGGGAGSDDIDGGNTVLTSPVFDPADISNQDILLTYDYWFFNDGGSTDPDDQMTVAITNGIATEVIRTYDNSTAVSAAWTTDNFAFSDLGIALTDKMRIIFNIGDTGNGHLVEGGLDNFSLTALARLPVTLSSFTATAVAKQTARLEWVTEEEDNASHFAVQRSADGINFATIGEVVAVGESSVSQTYSFVDADAAVGANFYRLEQVDRDGSSTLSEVRLVSFAGSEELVVYPNPVQDQLWILGADAGAVEVYESSGRLVRRFPAAEGQETINLADLAPGVYLVSVNGKSTRVVKR
ncbi:choice-of-anchor B family protein [Neolewinella aurantiaca]|uniref:Choice-of-anchor B family protein n=1 Tax=Neolewinella aurantiaca TaxID=2602767 RepID=A0A5C7FUQ2_9BACT|nr:choice-of-anchor B family protein [Neolewinella aurantiaca]TXF89185.1 choice-of-anchor B family protein [Neolewinella aurantiaca]